jgi:hypothetical protein
MPDLPRQLFISKELIDATGESVRQHFDEVVVLDRIAHVHRPRFESFLATRFDQAIFIDGDTLFIAPVYEVFEVLDHFDIALAHAPQYLSPQGVRAGVFEALPRVSLALPEWNAGVIAARVNDGFRSMVRRWIELFGQCRAMGFHMDQAPLRSALALSALRIATLSANYNFRANIAQGIAGTVKILHAHGDLARIGEYINESLAMRIYRPDPREIHGFEPKAP